MESAGDFAIAVDFCGRYPDTVVMGATEHTETEREKWVQSPAENPPRKAGAWTLLLAPRVLLGRAGGESP